MEKLNLYQISYNPIIQNPPLHSKTIMEEYYHEMTNILGLIDNDLASPVRLLEKRDTPCKKELTTSG
jgi:hypothetical protein